LPLKTKNPLEYKHLRGFSLSKTPGYSVKMQSDFDKIHE
jgi:hypothetical protein